jgi:1,4-alpha-glucan branching enzyme
VTRESPPWRLEAEAVAAIARGDHGDPFAVLGPHAVAGGVVIRSLAPGAETLEARAADGRWAAALERRDGRGVFEGLAHTDRAGAYRLFARGPGGAWDFDDAFRFGPVLGPLDDHLLVEGTHRRLFERLGAHPTVHEGAAGVGFAVWAPDARRVSLVGDFNGWDGRRHPMRKRIDSGLWEIFVPDLGEGAVYKYEILGAGGERLPLKADPVGFAAELRPSTASVVARIDDFPWSDQPWRTARAAENPRRAPMSIYEVHLGSWRRRQDGGFLTYDQIAQALIPYAADMGFTHLELMPVSEHPLDASWGYQPIGLFAPTRRFGDPAGFARLVDRAHGAGLGVIMDWVPAHFPTDAHGLARFDGTALYEYADPRKGFQPDWNTAVYDFGRREVVNMLLANALYWLEVFHIDALRVDAVASMLYLDYSRAAGAWSPNVRGGRENLEAEAFLRRLNVLVHAPGKGSLTVAEESTAWPGVTLPVEADGDSSGLAGGLGFDFKWNMGWMNDTLAYMARDPVHRRHHHDALTFGLTWAFSENFVLPISHDEVVHGKGSVIGRMPGDPWRRFAGARALYGYMWAYPGKKLLFMGQEFGQAREWDFDGELDWALLADPLNLGLRATVRDLNRLYRAVPALHVRDCEAQGFRWIVVDDAEQSVVAWLRLGEAGDPPVAVVCNFTPEPRHGYRIGLPAAGRWREIFNSDALDYGGAGLGNLGAVEAGRTASHGFPASASLTLPPLCVLYFQFQDGACKG